MTQSPFSDSDLAGSSGGLAAALAASGVVGAWLHDIRADRLTVCPRLARTLGLDPEEGERGMPLAALLAAAHGEDRDRVENSLHAAVGRGGAFTVAFRATPSPRWLDLRGRIEHDAAGQPARARGIVLDLTEDRTSAPRDQHTLNRMAEHAIVLRSLAVGVERPVLIRILDHLMLELGFELALHLRAAPDGQRH